MANTSDKNKVQLSFFVTKQNKKFIQVEAKKLGISATTYLNKLIEKARGLEEGSDADSYKPKFI